LNPPLNKNEYKQKKKHTNELKLNSNLVSKKILTRIMNFRLQMQDKFTQEQYETFEKHISILMEWLEQSSDIVEVYVSDSIAQCILFLVSTKIGVKKSVFITNMRPNIKNIRNKPKIENIKKLQCYPLLKKAYIDILNKIK